MKFSLIGDELCLDFVNTLNNRMTPEKRVDRLQGYPDLLDFAQQSNALPKETARQLLDRSRSDATAARAVLLRASELREALFRIFDRVARKRQPAEDDLKLLDEEIKNAFSHLRIEMQGKSVQLGFRNDERLDAPLWPVVRSAVNLLTEKDLEFVRECAAEDCRWMFVDRSKNHRRRWCDMKECGNRVKARKFYAKQKGS